MKSRVARLRVAFWIIEINLLLWLSVSGCIFLDTSNQVVKWTAGIGLTFALLTQHWSFYHLRSMTPESSRSAGRKQQQEY